MKIIIYDIEVSPKLGYYYPPDYETKGIRVERDWHLMSFAYKELGKKKIHVHALPDYQLYEFEPYNDRALLQDLRNMLDDADLVIGHNSDRFDNKKTNARLIFHGIDQPSPYETADTLKIARANFKFDSNRLDDLAQYLGLGRKQGSHGELWHDCLHGNEKAWRAMKRYNRQDVALTEQVYLKLRGWAKTHPNMSKYRNNEDDTACDRCASTNYQKRGFSPKASRWRIRYKCLNPECGKWFLSVKSYKVKPYEA